MDAMRINRRFIKVGDDMTWPDPDCDDLDWMLRYSSSQNILANRMVIASILQGYRELVRCPNSERNAVCNAIKSVKTTSSITGE